MRRSGAARRSGCPIRVQPRSALRCPSPRPPPPSPPRRCATRRWSRWSTRRAGQHDHHRGVPRLGPGRRRSQDAAGRPGQAAQPDPLLRPGGGGVGEHRGGAVAHQGGTGRRRSGHPDGRQDRRRPPAGHPGASGAPAADALGDEETAASAGRPTRRADGSRTKAPSRPAECQCCSVGLDRNAGRHRGRTVSRHPARRASRATRPTTSTPAPDPSAMPSARPRWSWQTMPGALLAGAS